MSRFLGFLYGMVAYILFLISFLYAIGFVGNRRFPSRLIPEPQRASARPS